MGDDDSLAAGEDSVAILHPHWKTLVRPVAAAFVVVAVLLVGEVVIPAGRAAAVERLALAAVGIALLLWWLMHPFLVWRTTVYELTTRRLRLRDGILIRNGRDIPLSRISDVSFRKGLLDRLLGCGTLVVESMGEHGEFELADIPQVERVFSALSQLVEDGRLRTERLRGDREQRGEPGHWDDWEQQDRRGHQGQWGQQGEPGHRGDWEQWDDQDEVGRPGE